VDRAALHARAAERLRAMIVRGELAPGGAIGEAELCAALGMSRTPLREALKLLATEGLVDLRPTAAPASRRSAPRRPTSCSRRSPASSASRPNSPPGAPTRGRSAACARSRTGSSGTTAAASSPTTSRSTSASTGDRRGGRQRRAGRRARLAARPRRAGPPFAIAASSARWSESVDEHREILAALEARDAERAGRALERHVLRTGEVVRAALRSPATPGNDEDEATRCAS
jgi:hypothetical protein